MGAGRRWLWTRFGGEVVAARVRSTRARALEGRKTRHHGLGRYCPVSQQTSYRYPRSNQLSSAQINSTQLA
jgi:hypothetical protein